MEVQQRKEIYKWGDDPNFIGLPGFIKSESVKTLPKDVQFTEEALDDLYQARRKALLNLGLVKLLNLFESWEDFDDYKKVINDTRSVLSSHSWQRAIRSNLCTR